jgi:hypothetical protein
MRNPRSDLIATIPTGGVSGTLGWLLQTPFRVSGLLVLWGDGCGWEMTDFRGPGGSVLAGSGKAIGLFLLRNTQFQMPTVGLGDKLEMDVRCIGKPEGLTVMLCGDAPDDRFRVVR